MFNGLSPDINGLSAIRECSNRVDTSYTSISSVLSPYSIKRPASIELPDPAAAENSDFLNHSVSLVKLDKKIGVRYLVRKLGPVKYEHWSQFVLPKDFDKLNYCETVRVMEEDFGQNSSLFYVRFYVRT
ncbi:unnamed protein product [Hymenolepis diminuta]|uniref:Uncharacterized protein n=1 Tax=Hymenolepis diminuta TaxID=6216 RepID=A0A564YLU6_HYMDI|nr:unnamed protein product [Hymenolepis diminuta]